MKKAFLFGLAALLFASCLFLSCASTGSANVSSLANVSIYNYGSIDESLNKAETTEVLNVGLKINESLVKTRLKIISDKEIENLSDLEKETLLIVNYNVVSDFLNGTIVTINFIDYNSKRPVATCKGQDVFRYGEPGINKASDDAAEQVKKLFAK